MSPWSSGLSLGMILKLLITVPGKDQNLEKKEETCINGEAEKLKKIQCQEHPICY